MMFRNLTPADTLESLFPEFNACWEADVEAKRKARFEGAKNNFERLQVLGVITTPDDEMDAAYRHQGVVERAKFYGVTFREVEAEDQDHANRSRFVNWVRDAVFYGETAQERSERLTKSLAEVPRSTKPDGKRCFHRAKYGNWFADRYESNDRRVAEYTCRGCGARHIVPARTEPTADAVECAVSSGRARTSSTPSIASPGWGVGTSSISPTSSAN